MKKIVLCVLLAGILLNCAEVYIEAPMKQDVQLLPENRAGTFVAHMKCFYLFWGLIPISDNSTSTLIAKYDLSNVRARTHFGILDWLVSYLTGGIFFSMSVDIEGDGNTLDQGE